MCAEPMGDEHGHVVDVEQRGLMCTCRACTLLFTKSEAAGRYRAVPDRVLVDPTARLTAVTWDGLQIPVAMAFFLRSSASDSVAAFYPSPAGATECLLDLDAWARLVDEQPLLAVAEVDVEGVIIRELPSGVTPGGTRDFECFVVPIDACYELVGRVRRSWKGFDGGADAHRDIEEFFARLRERAQAHAGST
jgi:hypothetical protein